MSSNSVESRTSENLAAESGPVIRCPEAETLRNRSRVHWSRSVFVRAFLVFFALSSLWAVASPLMAYPDEPSHTIRAAAVVRGQINIEPGTSFGSGIHVKVPSYIANLEAQKCFAFRSNITADCSPSIPSDRNFQAIGVTSAGAYNPMYYIIVGWPSLLLTGAPAIYAMRLMSALVCAMFFAAGFASLAKLRRPKWPLIAASIVSTPMIFFMNSGINPNALEIAATAGVFMGLLAILDRSRNLDSVKPQIALVGLSIITLANTRTVSVLWLACAAVIAIALYRLADLRRIFSNKFALAAVALAALGVVLGGLWMLVVARAPASTGTAPLGIANPAPDVRPYQAFLTMIDRSFDYVNQYIGVAGWLDAPAPQIALLWWNMLFALLLLLPFLWARPRRLRWVYAATLLMLALVPAILQAGLIGTVGFIWQGRYNLPMVVLVAVTAGMLMRSARSGGTAKSISAARLFFVIGIIMHVIVFAYVLRRYVAGLLETSTWQTMFTNPSWQPPGGWILLTVLYALIVLIAANGVFSLVFPQHRLLPVRTPKRAAPA